MDFIIGINQIYKQNVIQNKETTAEGQKINKSADTTSFTGNFSVLEQLAKINQYLLKKHNKNISFDENKTEFEERKAKLLSEMEKIDEFKEKKIYIYANEIKEYNIQILDEILTKKLYNNENLMNNLGYILSNIETQEQANAMISVLNRITSDKELCKNENIMKNLGYILSNIKTPEQVEIVKKVLANEKLYNNENIMNKLGGILNYTKTPELVKIVNKILDNEKLYNNENFMNNFFYILNNIKNTPEQLEIVKKVLDNEKNIATVENQIQQVYKKPELYINGEPENNTAVLSYFFHQYYADLLIFTELTDKETLDVLMRKRLDNAEEYFDNIRENFTGKDYELSGKLCKSTNQDGKPFMPTNKIDFINLISAYNQCQADKSKMYQMVETGRVNIGELNKDLFHKIMLDCGMTEEEISKIPNEKLMSWDLNYIHLLAQEINLKEDEAFQDIIKAGSAEDFVAYIHDKNNVYGQSNANTKRIFEEQNMNYEKWIKPAKDSEIQFKMKDKNTEQLEQVASLITKDMNELIETPVKGFLKKQFPKFINGDKFVIPNEYLTSKAKLLELVKIFTDENEQGQLSQVWNRAKGNANNPDTLKSQRAANTLTILDHLKQRIQDIEKIETSNIKTQNLDLTIKMWDRIPQKDIFQGNYSTCCIGMDGGNDSAMPHFVLNTSYNMIELVDNNTGKTIGNALCYFVNTNGKPAFIIDNIEINRAKIPSGEVGKQLRDAMAQYASNVAKEVTGKDDIHVYMSHKYNDVPTGDLKQVKQSVTFLGDVDCDEIYMDLYNGWVDKNKFTKKCELLKLR